MPDLETRRREAFRQAVEDDDVDETRRLLAEGPVAIDDDLLRGVLADAIGNYQARAPLLAVLIDAGADVDAREHDFGTTALMLAADAGDLEAIERLLGRGADPAVKDHDHETALAYAVREGHLRAAERLAAAAGVPLDAESRRRCFAGAAEHSRRGVIDELLGGPELELDRETVVRAFTAAAAAHDQATMATLRPLARPPLSRSERGEALLAAVRNVRVGDDDETLARRRAVVIALINDGADPEIAAPSDGTSAIFYAQDPAIVAFILGAGASPNRRRSDGASPFLVAAGRHDVPLMNLLLARGADPNARDLYGRSAAAYAERAGGGPDYQKTLALLATQGVQPQRWSDDEAVKVGRGDWLSVALFALAIAGIVFGLVVLRCTSE